MKTHTTTTLATALTLLAPGALAQHTIEDLAPEGAFLVVGFGNLEETLSRIQAGRLGQAWNEPAVLEQVGPALEDFNFQLTMLEEQMELEPGSLGLPRGAVGFSAFTALDPDLGLETLGILAMVDFAGSESTVQGLLDMMVANHGEEFDTIDIAGETFFALPIEPPNLDEIAEEAPEMGPLGDPMAMLEPFVTGLKTLYIGRHGSTLLVGTNSDVLAESVAAIDGEDVASVGDRAEYQSAIDEVGAGDMHIVVMVDQIGDVAQIAPFIAMAAASAVEPLNTLGFGNIQALSSSVDFDEAGAIVVQRSGVLVEGEKVGLLALLDNESPLEGVPAFVPADAGSYSRFNFDFGGMMDLINRTIASIPQFGAQADQAIAEYRPDLEALFSSLGDSIHIAGAGATSVYAMPLNDPQGFEGIVAKWAPQAGLEPRDFLGHAIYSGDFAPVAIGIGGGHAFIGEPQAVEQALRSVGEGAATTLASDEDFQHALGALEEAGVIGWGYAKAGSALDVLANPAAFAGPFAEMGGMGAMPPIDPAMIEAVKKHMGPSIWQLRSTDNGFVMTSWTLEPIEE